jgi:hypothetical protein
MDLQLLLLVIWPQQKIADFLPQASVFKGPSCEILNFRVQYTDVYSIHLEIH